MSRWHDGAGVKNPEGAGNEPAKEAFQEPAPGAQE